VYLKNPKLGIEPSRSNQPRSPTKYSLFEWARLSLREKSARKTTQI
jgi:hypothetical protein